MSSELYEPYFVDNFLGRRGVVLESRVTTEPQTHLPPTTIKPDLIPVVNTISFIPLFTYSSTMYRDHLHLTALPAWCKLNDVNFLDSKVEDLGGSKGFGLITERSLNSKETFDIPTLLAIPRDLILSGVAVEEHAKADGAFRQLIETAGGKVCFDDPRMMDLKGTGLIGG